MRALKGGSYFHFPAQNLTKSNCTNPIVAMPCLAQILIPFPFSIAFFVDESQSQCMKSYFPSQKWANPSSHFTLHDPLKCMLSELPQLCILTLSIFYIFYNRRKVEVNPLHFGYFWSLFQKSKRWRKWPKR